MEKYRQLRRSDPGMAESYLSKVFQASSAFTIALVGKHGEQLSRSDMVDEIVFDLKGRADNSFMQDPKIALQLRDKVSELRRKGG